MKFGSTVTSIWRVTARYMRAVFRNPSDAIIAKSCSGTNHRPGMTTSRSSKNLGPSFQHSFDPKDRNHRNLLATVGSILSADTIFVSGKRVRPTPVQDLVKTGAR